MRCLFFGLEIALWIQKILNLKVIKFKTSVPYPSVKVQKFTKAEQLILFKKGDFFIKCIQKIKDNFSMKLPIFLKNFKEVR